MLTNTETLCQRSPELREHHPCNQATNRSFIQPLLPSNHHQRLPKDIIQRTRQPVRSGVIPSTKAEPTEENPVAARTQVKQ
ncbi:hypothetical protein M9458_056925, partial [Cirrhinus mrigala]